MAARYRWRPSPRVAEYTVALRKALYKPIRKEPNLVICMCLDCLPDNESVFDRMKGLNPKTARFHCECIGHSRRCPSNQSGLTFEQAVLWMQQSSQGLRDDKGYLYDDTPYAPATSQQAEECRSAKRSRSRGTSATQITATADDACAARGEPLSHVPRPHACLNFMS